MNLIDGIDGLASGVGITASAVFGFLFRNSDNISYTVICFSLTGSLFAFFYFNVFSKKNKIFLGDTGSMLIGFLLALFAIHFLENYNPGSKDIKIVAAPAIVLAILIMPVFDTIRIIVIRSYKKQPLFRGDNNHLHHKVLRISGSHLKATLIILGVNLMLVLFTFLAQGLGNLMLIVIILLFMTTVSVTLDLLSARRVKNEVSEGAAIR
jgi:UDP-N-acetylmuramyl pentapeptide phosphotransferase/UDP-N-acetylglucosamine-1-phosphate transferase